MKNVQADKVIALTAQRVPAVFCLAAAWLWCLPAVAASSTVTNVLLPSQAIPLAAAVSGSLPLPPSDGQLRVAIYKGPGTGGAGPGNLLRKLNNPPHSTVMYITPEDIRCGALTNYNVVIFAGGSGSKQAEALHEQGRTAVRGFVESGGSYVGICAGAYLATSGYSWSLGLINARTASPKWRRGVGNVQVEFTKEGCGILGQKPGRVDIRYANGPIVQPAGKEDLPTYNTLAFFRTELAENDTPAGIMIDSPAIFSSTYKNGNVVCISPHPEQTQGLEEMVPLAVAWAVREKISISRTE